MVLLLFKVLSMIVCFILYAYLKGYLQAYYYHNRNLTRENLHWAYFLEACFFAFLCSFFMLNNINLWRNIFIVASNMTALGLIFPYFHDGAYYLTRNILNPLLYKLKWKDYNDSKDAKHDFVYTDRLGMLIVGSLGLIIVNIINIFV